MVRIRIDRRRLARASVVSFDVFDTALFRRIDRPTDVFEYQALRSDTALPPDYRDLRIACEEEARRKAPECWAGEIGLDDIFREVGAAHSCGSWTPSELAEVEFGLERDRFLVANPVIRDLYDWLRQKGVPVIFVTDMYLAGAHVSSLLKTAGFHEPKVFASSDCKASKHAGTLFAKVENVLAVSGHRIWHIGDNPHSDVVQAKAAGWNALHYDRSRSQPALLDRAPDWRQSTTDLLSLIMAGCARIACRPLAGPLASKTRETAFRLGACLRGPLLLGISQWVIQRLRDNGIHEIRLPLGTTPQLRPILKELAQAWRHPLCFSDQPAPSSFIEAGQSSQLRLALFSDHGGEEGVECYLGPVGPGMSRPPPIWLQPLFNYRPIDGIGLSFEIGAHAFLAQALPVLRDGPVPKFGLDYIMAAISVLLNSPTRHEKTVLGKLNQFSGRTMR